MHFLWIGGGLLFFGLGAIGVVVPVLPTIPFVILAAACFARGSPRLHRWIGDHRRFGPLVRDWEDHRAIRSRHRRAAIVAIILVGGVSVALLPRWEGRVALSAVLLSATIFIATRPDPPEESD